MDTDARSAPAQKKPARAWPLWAALAMLAFAGIAILYVVLAGGSKPAQQNNFVALATGPMHSLAVLPAPPATPQRAFTDAAGNSLTLHDLEGQVVVVNLWATWCAPCMEEMPTLGALQRRFAGRVRVIPISVDGAEERAKAQEELARLTQGALPFYIDESRGLLFDLEAAGMPTTIIYDKHGRELARLSGGADWSSDAAAAVIEAALAAG